MASGYTHCPCCGDDTISSDMAKPELCELCEGAGCSGGEGDTCERTHDGDGLCKGHDYHDGRNCPNPRTDGDYCTECAEGPQQ